VQFAPIALHGNKAQIPSKYIENSAKIFGYCKTKALAL